ncbi:hypothetical protein LOD99_3696 [Oopsacas minuta]|uniref:Mediator of RNA polymerase II transcription subunit 9 n=1 Tax=Oopsacas minuta TaxID=111878 RepID=A0AAV7JXC5_9METZ|nr:hypothetical protein LOD99_3696 [Oopsacas minuta]
MWNTGMGSTSFIAILVNYKYKIVIYQKLFIGISLLEHYQQEGNNNSIQLRFMAELKGHSTIPSTVSSQDQPDIANFRNAFNSLLTQVFVIINNCNKETKESETGNQNELISNFSRQMNKCHDMVEQMEGLDTTPRELEDSITQVKQQIEQRVEVIKKCKEDGLFLP